MQLNWKVLTFISIRSYIQANILLIAVGRAVVLSSGALPGHTQCEFRSVSNNNQQNQCYTVWSETRRDIHCGDHSICAVKRRGTKDVYFQ